MARKRSWLKVFDSFIDKLRIDSKEESSADGAGTKLKLWGSQRRALNSVAEGMDDDVRAFYFLKSRQLGISTVFLAIDLFWLATHPRMIGVLVVDTDGNRENFRDILTRYVESFPPGYLGESFAIVKSNAKFMSFSNGSRLDFLVAGTKSKATWGEGRAYALAHLTEVSKYGDRSGLNSFLEALSETNPDRLYIFESTANGINHWKDMCDEARSDTHTKKFCFVGWWSKPLNAISRRDKRFATFGLAEPSADERELIELVWEQYQHRVTPEQIAWYRWRQSNQSTSKNDLDQHQPWVEQQAFIMSGFSFFQTRLLMEDRENRVREWLGYRFHMGNDFMASSMEQIIDPARLPEVALRVWYEPEPGAHYVIGVDPAYGSSDEADRHCIGVWRCFADRLVQCAEYSDNISDTRQCAWVLAFLAGAYRNCMINLEVSGGAGHAVMMELKHVKENLRSDRFANVVSQMQWDDFLENARWYMYHRPDAIGAGYVYNWQTTATSKFRIMNQFKDSHVMRLLEINSVGLIEEMQNCTQNGTKVAAASGNDDRVLAATFADIAWKEWVRPRLIQEGYYYDTIMRTNSSDKVESFLAQIVQTTMARAAAEAEEPTTKPSFLEKRGLA